MKERGRLNKVNGMNKSLEYVADDGWIPHFTFDVEDEEQGISYILTFLNDRISALVENIEEPPIIMLSGGIDSILAAVVLKNIRPDSLAVTFALPNSTFSDYEVDIAHKVSSLLELEHIVISPSGEEYVEIIKETSRKLESKEPWEVLAGSIVFAVSQKFPTRKLITGGGADSLFLGGEKELFTEIPLDYEKQWEKEVTKKINKNFARQRFIPDFYERIMDNPENYILLWQCKEAVEVAQKLHPHLIRGKDWLEDKLVLRKAAIELGIPPYLALTPKVPMQESSGALSAIVKGAQQQLQDFYGDKTYRSPQGEDLQWTVARMFLMLND